IPRREIAQILQRAIEEIDVDVATLAGRARGDDAGEQAEPGEKPGHIVDDGKPHPRRWTVRLAGECEIAGFRLHEIVIAGPRRARAGAAIGREMRADDARVRLPERGISEAQALRLVAAQIVEDAVGFFCQRMEDLARGFLLEVERQAALVAVEALKEVTVVLTQEERPDAARHVAALGGVLDLDDLGAQIGELHRAIGSGAVLLDGDDAHAPKRRHQMRFRSTSWRAMMMRCISLVPSPITSKGASR